MNLQGSCKNKKIFDQADEFYASACFFAEKMFTNNLLAKSRKVKYNRINLIIDVGIKA